MNDKSELVKKLRESGFKPDEVQKLLEIYEVEEQKEKDYEKSNS